MRAIVETGAPTPEYLDSLATDAPGGDDVATHAAPRQEHAARQVAMSRLGRRGVSEVVAQSVAELQVRREHGVTGWSTGIKSLDEHVRRVMAPGRIIAVAGDTKSGKTAFAGQLVLALAAQGVPVLLGSFEDEQQDTMLRYIANLSSSDVGTLRDGFVRPDGSKLPVPEAFDTAAEKLAALNIELIANAGTVEQIAYETADWWEGQSKAGFAFGCLVVDQLSHIIPSNRATFSRMFPGYPPPPAIDRTVDMLEWQVAMLQRIARKLNLLVIVLSQLNANHEVGEVPDERSLRGSKGIGHKVDAMLVPWRPAKIKNPTPGLGEPKYVPNVEGRAWIVSPIARTVTAFQLEVTWHGGHQRYTDLGAPYRAPWFEPAKLTDEQQKGMAALAELKNRWNDRSAGLLAVANGAKAVMPEPLALTAAADPEGIREREPFGMSAF